MGLSVRLGSNIDSHSGIHQNLIILSPSVSTTARCPFTHNISGQLRASCTPCLLWQLLTYSASNAPGTITCVKVTSRGILLRSDPNSTIEINLLDTAGSHHSWTSAPEQLNNLIWIFLARHRRQPTYVEVFTTPSQQSFSIGMAF